MSLLKQTQILVTLLLTITLIIVLRINFNTAREFTTNESYLTTKNQANMLALTLNTMPNDLDFMKTSINAMFDGGYFESISLIRQDNTMAYEKHEKVVIHGVPSFFINYVDLTIPEVEANVMAGWSVFGTLKIKGHPGTSYLKLWNTLKQLCIQFFVLGILAFLVSLFGLKHLLSALDKIKLQAEKISNNEFIINKKIPNTPELKQVVIAMNTMVGKVESNFERNLKNLSRYQKLRYEDKVTGLHNRSSFVKQLGILLQGEDENIKGHVVLLSMSGMKEIEASDDRLLINKIFQQMADRFKTAAETIPNALIARFPRGEFAAILPDTDSEEGLNLVETAINNFLSQKDKDIPDSINAYAGIASYTKNEDMGIILSKVDYALASAKSGLPGDIRLYRDDSFKKALGKQEWKTLIDIAFSKSYFLLTAQPVISDEGEFHREVFVYMVDQKGEKHKAALFIPMIHTLGLSTKLDNYILEKSAAYLENNPEKILAVNITSEFCRDRMTGPWLRKFLIDNKSLANNLMFEIHENTVINFPEVCLDIAGLIRGMGFKFGIDRFTMHDTSLNMLKTIKPHYIKVERDYLEVFDDPKKADMVLNSILTITESIGIELIAVKVENETQKRELAEKNVPYFQGHGIADIVSLKG